MKKHLKTLLKILSLIMNRGFILYVLLFILFLSIFDQQRAMLKTMDYLSDTPRYVTNFAVGREKFDRVLFVSAIRYYKIFSKVFPISDIAKTALGYCYYQMGEDDKTIEYYHQALKKNPNLFAIHYNLGKIYYQQKNYDRATKHFQQAIDLFFKDKAFAFSGGISPYKFTFDKDLTKYNARTLEMQYIYAKCYESLIWCYEKKKDYSAILDSAITGIKLPEKEDKSFFYHFAGLASFELGDYDAAVKFFKKSLEMDSNNMDSVHLLNLSFEKMGRHDIADQVKANEAKLRETGKGHRILEPQGHGQLFYYPPFNIIEVDGAKIRKM